MEFFKLIRGRTKKSRKVLLVGKKNWVTINENAVRIVVGLIAWKDVTAIAIMTQEAKRLEFGRFLWVKYMV